MTYFSECVFPCLTLCCLVTPSGVTRPQWVKQICSTTSHYLNQCSLIVNGTFMNKLQWNLLRKAKLFIQENSFENVVCKMTAILLKPHHVKPANWSMEFAPLTVGSLVPCVAAWVFSRQDINTLRPDQNGRHFPDDIFKCIFLNENVWISINITLKFVPSGPINNIPALVQITAWCQSGNKALSEPMLVSLLKHICVTQPQCVNKVWLGDTHSIRDFCHHWFMINRACRLFNTRTLP